MTILCVEKKRWGDTVSETEVVDRDWKAGTQDALLWCYTLKLMDRISFGKWEVQICTWIKVVWL
jgi:hypothetical protein